MAKQKETVKAEPVKVEEKKPVTKKQPRKKPVRKKTANKSTALIPIKDLPDSMKEIMAFDPVFNSYEQQLSFYKEQREAVNKYIADNLKEGVDYGYTTDDRKKKTLMKSGAEKIAAYMNCRVKFYHDHATYNMIGGEKSAICFTAYLIDEKILKLITMAIVKFGFEVEERIVKLFAWGEGRGAYELDEICYKQSGKPLKGSYNRAVKLAEKRAETDLIIRVFGLDFAQDPELSHDEIKEVYQEAMKVLRKSPMQNEQKKKYKYAFDNAVNIKEIETIIEEIKDQNPNKENSDLEVKEPAPGGKSIIDKLTSIANDEKDMNIKISLLGVIQKNKDNIQILNSVYKDISENKGNKQVLKNLLKKYS